MEEVQLDVEDGTVSFFWLLTCGSDDGDRVEGGRSGMEVGRHCCQTLCLPLALCLWFQLIIICTGSGLARTTSKRDDNHNSSYYTLRQ